MDEENPATPPDSRPPNGSVQADGLHCRFRLQFGSVIDGALRAFAAARSESIYQMRVHKHAQPDFHRVPGIQVRSGPRPDAVATVLCRRSESYRYALLQAGKVHVPNGG